MFESLNRMQQGDLGEARATYELVRLGYSLSKPLHVHLPYDFIADKDGILYRVQVKTSGVLKRKSTQAYECMVATTGGNRQINTTKWFDSSAVDLLFVMTADDRCWLIPTIDVTSSRTVTVGTEKYAKYQISGEVFNRPSTPTEEFATIDKREKTPPFSRDELATLMVTMPTCDIGTKFGMSDNGVARWAKKWNIPKPPRGYWQKKKAGKL